METGPARLGGEPRLVEGASVDLELPLGVFDLADGAVAGYHLGYRLADGPVLAHRPPVEDPVAVETLPEVGDDRNLRPGPGMAGRATVGETDIVEHRLLGGGLRLLVPG